MPGLIKGNIDYHNTFTDTDRKKKPLNRGLVLSFDADVREFKPGIFLGLCDLFEYKKQQLKCVITAWLGIHLQNTSIQPDRASQTVAPLKLKVSVKRYCICNVHCVKHKMHPGGCQSEALEVHDYLFVCRIHISQHQHQQEQAAKNALHVMHKVTFW